MPAAALAYIRSNLPIFPLHYPTGVGACSCRDATCDKVGKHPMTQHGLKDATTDRQTIEKWWSENPLANIGLPTGARSGVVVVDIDHRHGALETLERLEKRIGTLPATLVSRTGAGLHHFYKYPGVTIRSGIAVLGPGIDIRGDGGYVVVPPSLHVNGKRYEWLRCTTK
jgi:putative DNA primase/helicase